jgi:hypothetical protein
MFWHMGSYDLFILKCVLDTFWNIKKFETKNSHEHLHMLHVHKVVSSKFDFNKDTIFCYTLIKLQFN